MLGLDLKPVTDLVSPLVETTGTTLETTTEPVTTALAPTVDTATTTLEPVVETVQETTKPLAPLVESVVETVEPIVEPVTQPVVDDVVAPVVDHVVTPVVDDVVAPVVAPSLEPVTEPVIDSISETTTPITEPVQEILEPTVDPVVDDQVPTNHTEASGPPETGEPSEASGSSEASTNERSQEVTDQIPASSPNPGTGGNTHFDGITAAPGDPATASAEMPHGSAITADRITAHHRPSSSSGLPETTSSTLPAGVPCSGPSGGSGALSLIGTAPGVDQPSVPGRHVSTQSTTTAVPAGQPRPQPGFSPG